MLQETHCVKGKEKIWMQDWGNKIYFSNGCSTARGVCICLGVNLKYKFIRKTDTEG